MSGLPEDLMRSVEILIAKNEIQELYQRYARAVDRLDRVGLESIYHPDAREDHGIYDGPVEGFIDTCFALAPVLTAMHHTIAPALIEIDGNQATAEAYYIMYQRNRADGADKEEFFGGRYLDRLEKRNGEWRIAHRRMVLDFGHAQEADPWLTDEVRARFNLLEGTRDRADPLYARPVRSAAA